MTKQTNVLVEDDDRYGGQYVATKSFADKTVVSHGLNPADVHAEAKEKGYKDPVVVYIPPKGIVQIY
jgi:hypothetical protein